ncbi:MAG: 3-deoxy-7-phosphoheptulonate synthase [Bacteroidetes bacterium HGW-Bacteroidetes-17]|jgi:3-deoxy-7-phosphoheptulonate synthase|nr:MAG: 3-deoxy-7-phosphoheptulonate synthase [Bacteroidetes bacterium HGW-Bacteroidetes-17]
MIIQLKDNLSETEKLAIKKKITELGYQSTEVKTQKKNYLICIGKNEVDIRMFGQLKGVADVHRVNEDYKLVSRKWKVSDTTIDLGDGIKINNGAKTIMAGPCSVESEDQIRDMVSVLKKNGVGIIRGGVFKPRSSPYSFQGHGLEALKRFHAVARETGMKIITEVMQVSQVEQMYPYVDIFQVGARNSQNFNLLSVLGEVDKPVLIKRGISGSIDELLQSAEYVFSSGNERLILCERGIRTYEKAYRNTLDLNAVPILKEKTHLPVIVDPSHGIGIRRFVEPMSLAAIAAGADGLMLEIHREPENALSDGFQSLNFEEFEALVNKVKLLYSLL